MHEAEIIVRHGIIDMTVDFKVCTCKIGSDHKRINGKNIKPEAGQ